MFCQSKRKVGMDWLISLLCACGRVGSLYGAGCLVQWCFGDCDTQPHSLNALVFDLGVWWIIKLTLKMLVSLLSHFLFSSWAISGDKWQPNLPCWHCCSLSQPPWALPLSFYFVWQLELPHCYKPSTTQPSMLTLLLLGPTPTTTSFIFFCCQLLPHGHNPPTLTLGFHPSTWILFSSSLVPAVFISIFWLTMAH